MAALKSTVAPPDLSLLRQVARIILERHLVSVSGRNGFDLIMESSLMRPLDRLVQGASFFKQNGAQRIFKLEEKMNGDIQRIYLIRPTVENVRMIIGHVTTAVAKQRSNPNALPIKTTILFVPRKSFVCEQVLEEEGVYGHVILEDCKLDLIPLDDDLMSLELPMFFRNVYLEHDSFWLHTVAASMANLQTIFGPFSNIVTLGANACHVKKILSSMPVTDMGAKKQIHTAIVLDRNLDLITPLMTQITYEGMLDEHYDIDCCMVDFPEEITGKKGATKMLLTNDDEIYKEVRNRHFTNVFGFLKHKAKSLQSEFEKRHDISSVGEMKDFVGNQMMVLKAAHKSLELHISACENIIKKTTGPDGAIEDRLRAEHTLIDRGLDSETTAYIEDHLAQQTDPLHALRILCLASLVADGLSEREYASFKTQFLQAHGYDHLALFHALRELGFFKPFEESSGEVSRNLFATLKSSSFARLNSKLKLVPRDRERENADLKNPTSMSYVFSGAYSPLSCRIVEEILTRGYEASIENLELLTRCHEGKRAPASARFVSGAAVPKPTPAGSAVLVYFLGGVTFAEVAALRFLGKVRGLQFLIATTSFVNGDSMMEKIADSV